MSDRSAGARLFPPLQRAVGAVLDWVYPRHCPHCERSLNGEPEQLLCAACAGRLEERRIGRALCATCGLPLAIEPDPEAECTTCVAVERHFDRARAFFTYAVPVISLIRSYKFEGCYYLGPDLLRAELAEGGLPAGLDAPDAVLGVPLHRRRRRERGYDQAVLLARVVARHLGCDLLRRAVVRTRYTSQQARLSMRQRWDNMRNAFAVRAPEQVEGRRLLLVDDVMTTGVTAGGCARVLKAAGAEGVQVLTLTRTAP